MRRARDPMDALVEFSAHADNSLHTRLGIGAHVTRPNQVAEQVFFEDGAHKFLFLLKKRWVDWVRGSLFGN
jgi:hypothetical protein